MKTNAIRATCAAALLGVSACAHSVTTAPSKPAETNNGVIYALPKTRIDVTIIYTVKISTPRKNGVATAAPSRSVVIKKPIVVTPSLVPDPDNQFILSGDGLSKDSRLDASFKFAVDDNQLLTSVSSDVTDKSPEIFQSLVGAGISVAKLAAVAGQDPVEELYSARIAALDQEIVEVSAGKGKDRFEEIKKLMAERALMLESLYKYAEANSPATTETDVSYTTSLNMAALIAGNESEIAAPGGLLGVGNNLVPVVKAKMVCTEDQVANSSKRLFQATEDEARDGVYYRVPSRALLTLTANGVETVRAELAVAQLGPINKVEARYKMWARRKTTINFSKSTGSLSDYGVESTSSGEAAAKAIATSADKAQQAVTELKKLKDAEDAKQKTAEEQQLAELEQKKKLLETELAVLKAEKALTKEKEAGPTGGN